MFVHTRIVVCACLIKSPPEKAMLFGNLVFCSVDRGALLGCGNAERSLPRLLTPRALVGLVGLGRCILLNFITPPCGRERKRN